MEQPPPNSKELSNGWRERLYTIIFEADTVAGRRFDTMLLILIVLSVITVIIDSVGSVRSKEYLTLHIVEWVFTGLFTIEYIARLACVKHPLRYALSWFGIIDLLAILPTYLSFAFPELHFLIDIRLLRLLRIFRILKLPGFFDESQVLWMALKSSRYKIMVFLGVVLIMSVILGTIMYIVEGPKHGFTSIPVGMYWAIATYTTTGYGDIHAQTPLGQFITSCAMLVGYGIIALPTGIIGIELAMSMTKNEPTTRRCTSCLSEGHDPEANFCMDCGEKLPPYRNDLNENGRENPIPP